MNAHNETALPQSPAAKHVSIGIIAWNEEKAIGRMLDSLFQQSLFEELHRRGQTCEIICITNGCTDRTPEIVSEIFARQAQAHPWASAFSCRALDIQERGKINAWNLFVHSCSAREARFLFLMDSDILIHRPNALWNMLLTLEHNPEASVAVDTPCKDIAFKRRKIFRERLSLMASRLTRFSRAQLCGQLYCIRADIARNIYLPRDLAACEDGFVKALVCTDFLAHPVWPMRIQLAHDAAHTFEAYISASGIFKNQKRQIIGQTIVHILVDKYLKNLSPMQRSRLTQTLQAREEQDPDWLKRLIGEHVRMTRFSWRLYPGLLAHSFRRLKGLNFAGKLLCFPVAALSLAVALVSSFGAFRTLKAGCTNYWPRADRGGFKEFELDPPSAPQLTR